MDIKELIKQIEDLRADLINIKQGRRFTDPEVVRASQKLDELLDMYQEMTKDPLPFN